MKNPEDKITNINSKNKITSCLMVGASEGVEGYMILTRSVAALPVTFVFCLDHVFLKHNVSSSNFLYFSFLVHVVRKKAEISKYIRAEYE